LKFGDNLFFETLVSVQRYPQERISTLGAAMKTALIVSAFVLGVVLAPYADANRADRRQHRQGARIQHGTESGSINAKESARLKRGQERIQRAEDKAMSDGDMTAKEKVKLERMQDHQSRKIRQFKNNNNDGAVPQSQLPPAGQTE
jgi:hypothetical protein